MNCFVDATHFRDRLSQFGWTVAHLEGPHDRGRLYWAEFQRSRKSKQVIPMLRDEIRIDFVVGNSIQRAVVGMGIDRRKARIPHIRDPRSIPKYLGFGPA